MFHSGALKLRFLNQKVNQDQISFRTFDFKSRFGEPGGWDFQSYLTQFLAGVILLSSGKNMTSPRPLSLRSNQLTGSWSIPGREWDKVIKKFVLL